MVAKITLKKHDKVLKNIDLEKTVLTIGRRHINDLHLDDPGVSGNHAKILTVGNESFLEDLQSTNGTFVNGKRIEKSPLYDQDVVLIGEFEMLFSNDFVGFGDDDDAEKTIIMKPNSVVMNDPESEHIKAPPVKTKEPAPATKSAAPQIQTESPSSTTYEDAPLALSEGQAKLTVVDGESKGKSLVLSKIITRVKGPRGQSCAISKKADGYYLLNTLMEDLAPSVNGVLVPVGSSKLQNGDVISMGNSKLSFSAS